MGSGGHLTMFPTDTDAKTQEQSTPKKESPIFPREEALGFFHLMQTSAVRCCEALMEGLRVVLSGCPYAIGRPEKRSLHQFNGQLMELWGVQDHSRAGIQSQDRPI